MAIYEIPLRPETPSRFSVAINGTTYNLRTIFLDVPEGGWILDINDASGDPLVAGLPLTTGENILAQFPALGFNFKMAVMSDAPDRQAVPTWESLGDTSHLLVSY